VSDKCYVRRVQCVFIGQIFVTATRQRAVYSHSKKWPLNVNLTRFILLHNIATQLFQSLRCIFCCCTVMDERCSMECRSSRSWFYMNRCISHEDMCRERFWPLNCSASCSSCGKPLIKVGQIVINKHRRHWKKGSSWHIHYVLIINSIW